MLALARERRARLEGAASQMEALSHARVLLRGYAMVGRGAGRPVTAAAQVVPGEALTLRFHDGEVRAVAEGAVAPTAKRTRRRTGPSPPGPGDGGDAGGTTPEPPPAGPAAPAAARGASGDASPVAPIRVARRSGPPSSAATKPAQETLL